MRSRIPALLKLIQAKDPGKLDDKEQKIRQSLLWYVTLPDLIHSAVGFDAENSVRDDGIKHNFEFWGPQLAIFNDLDHIGDRQRRPVAGPWDWWPASRHPSSTCWSIRWCA